MNKDILKLNDQGTEKLSMAILKRKKVQEQLALILKSVKAAEEEIVKLQDANNLHLTEMVSILERKSACFLQTAPHHHEDDGNKQTNFSKLMGLVDDACPNDTAEALKLKMIESVERYEQMLSESITIETDCDFLLKTKIRALLYNENDQQIPTCNLLESGFRINSAESSVEQKEATPQRDLILISYAIFSLLQKQNVSFKNTSKNTEEEPIQQEVPPSVINNIMSQYSSLPPTILPMASSGKFILGQSIFVLRLFQSGIPKGEIHIKPVPAFIHPTFVQQLGDFCYRSQKHFFRSILRVR